jgi:hypothetical protein
MKCVRCARLQSLAVSDARIYHRLAADLECSYISHDSEAQIPLSSRLEKAFSDRDTTRAELLLHEKDHGLEKPAAA